MKRAMKIWQELLFKEKRADFWEKHHRIMPAREENMSLQHYIMQENNIGRQILNKEAGR